MQTISLLFKPLDWEDTVLGLEAAYRAAAWAHTLPQDQLLAIAVAHSITAFPQQPLTDLQATVDQIITGVFPPGQPRPRFGHTLRLYVFRRPE